MRASTSINARRVQISLLAAALALAVWGATVLAGPQSLSDLSQRPYAGMQTADGGGGRPNG